MKSYEGSPNQRIIPCYWNEIQRKTLCLWLVIKTTSPWKQSQKVKRVQWRKHTLALKLEPKKHTLPLFNWAQNQQISKHKTQPMSQLVQLRDWNLTNSHLQNLLRRDLVLRSLYVPYAHSVGSCPFPPRQRQSLSSLPNKSLDWDFCEDPLSLKWISNSLVEWIEI